MSSFPISSEIAMENAGSAMDAGLVNGNGSAAGLSSTLQLGSSAVSEVAGLWDSIYKFMTPFVTFAEGLVKLLNLIK